MRSRRVLCACLLCSALAVALFTRSGDANVPGSKAHDGGKAVADENYGRLGLVFEVNAGQTDSHVKFQCHGRGYALFLEPGEAVLSLSKSSSPISTQSAGALPATGLSPRATSAGDEFEPAPVCLQLLGANPNARIVGLDELSGKANYFIGNDPSKWRTNISTYAKVKYEGIYPGIDLIFYGDQGQLEFDFIVAPGADPKAIKLGLDQHFEIGRDGNLVLSAAGGDIRFEKPVVYQQADGIRRGIANEYSMLSAGETGTLLRKGVEIGVNVEAYDRTRPLIIDPVLNYSTYLGGGLPDYGEGIAVDANGSAYVTGYTSSTNFPTKNPLQPLNAGGSDVFVAKLSTNGLTLEYCTYLGGNSNDQGSGIAVDASGAAYVTGNTFSTNFPTLSPLQGANGGSTDAFVAKLSANGAALVYSTYLGGSSSEDGDGIAVDATGAAYVTGDTGSINFPTKNPLQPSYAGGFGDVFVSKLDATGSALVYSTYLGGSGFDKGMKIAVDASDSAYVTGNTTSTNFPTQNPLQAAYGGLGDAFVTKFNAGGSALAYSTYLGGSSADSGSGIAVDATGAAMVTGLTYSTNFPTQDPLQPTTGGGGDAFVAKLNAGGSALVYGTYLGGSQEDSGLAIATDAAGAAYVTGLTLSANFPSKSPLQGPAGQDAFVTKLNASGAELAYSTHLGGSANDDGHGIVVDGSGAAYVIGTTYSANFPTKNAFQGIKAGSPDPFVTKIDHCAEPWITNQPQSLMVASGQTATLKVAVFGTPPLNYEWYEGTYPDATHPVGTNSDSYTTIALTATTSFWVQAANPCGGAISDTATVTVTSGPIITTITSKTSKPGSSVTIYGTGFSTNKKKDVVYFGTRKVKSINKAKATSLKLTIPKVKKGIVSVYMVVNGKTSNTVQFQVK